MDMFGKMRVGGLFLGAICGIGGGAAAIHYGLNQAWAPQGPMIKVADHEINIGAVQNAALTAYGALGLVMGASAIGTVIGKLTPATD